MNDLILNLSMNTIVLRLIWQRATGSPSFSGSFKVLEHSDFHFEIIIQICGLNDGHSKRSIGLILIEPRGVLVFGVLS